MRKIDKNINIAIISIIIGVVLGPGPAYAGDASLRVPLVAKNQNFEERFKQAFRRRYGGKILGLIELTKFAKQLGFKVPYFDKIGTEIFNGFLGHNSITRAKIDEIYARHLVDKKSEEYKKKVPHFFDWIQEEPYHPDAYREVVDLFYKGEFPEEQDAQLRQVFDRIRKKDPSVIAIRSSSILEDSKEYQFKGIYDSNFLYCSGDSEKEFKKFKEKIKMGYASIFSPKARQYRLENSIPDEDEMGILVQVVVGKIHQGYRFYPPLSGITLFDPYNPNATISDINLGLNTKTVRGEYRYRVAYITDPSGKRHFSGSFPSVESYSGKLERRYDYIDTYTSSITENYLDLTIRGSESLYLQYYKEDKINFLNKRKGDGGFADIAFSYEFTSKMDVIAKRIRELMGPVELEWSVDDEGEINIYQCRFSYDFAKFFQQDAELESVSPERIVAQSNIVSGHGNLLAPMIVVPLRKSSLIVAEDIWKEIGDTGGSNGYILVVDAVGLTEEASRAVAYFFSSFFPNMIGLLNISDEPIPLAAHWSETFIRDNILVVSTTKINKELLNQICDQKDSDVRYSSGLVKMVVNGVKQKGQIYLPERSIVGESIREEDKFHPLSEKVISDEAKRTSL